MERREEGEREGGERQRREEREGGGRETEEREWRERRERERDGREGGRGERGERERESHSPRGCARARRGPIKNKTREGFVVYFLCEGYFKKCLSGERGERGERDEREREGNSLTHQVSKLIYSVLGSPIFLCIKT